jgi:hypothetical protein
VWPLAIFVLLIAGCRPPYAVDNPPERVVLQWDGASSGPPLPANRPPNSITVQWNPATSSLSDVRYVVEHHCLAWDMHAEEVREEQSGANRVATFVCKGPLVH